MAMARPTVMISAIATDMLMTDLLPANEAHYLLSAWFSPSYPVGAFSYSHGLEMAVEEGLIFDQKSSENFVRNILTHGAGQLDAQLLAAAYKAAQQQDDKKLMEIAELAATFGSTKELTLESHAQGAAFLKVTRDCWPNTAIDQLAKIWPGPNAYSIAVGVAAAGAILPLELTLTAYLHGFAANVVSALVRLVPLGQTDGQKTTQALMSDITEISQMTSGETPENFSSSTLMVERCSMQHEDQYTRLFRS